MIELYLPWALLALPLPWLVRLVLPAAKESGAALRVPFYRALAEADAAGRHATPWRSRTAVALKTLAWVLLVFAAAQPRWLGPPREVPTSGRDLMLALDLSGSMRTPDFEVRGQAVDRFSVVRAVAREFALARKGDRVGLVLFGTRAFLHAPLTADLRTVAQLLDESEIGLAGEETAIGDALGLAVKHLRKRPEGERVLVLLSDGENNAGVLDPQKASELARDAGVRVYTIGVGTGAQALATPFGVRATRPVPGGADQETLRAIAQQTGGKHFRADDTESLVAVYREIDALEPTHGDPATVRPVRALFAWPLAAALALVGGLGLGGAAGELASRAGSGLPVGSTESVRSRRSVA